MRPAVPRPLPLPREGPLPLSFVQEHLWFLDRLEPGRATYNLPALVFRMRGRLDVPVLIRTLDVLARRHEAFRTTFGEVDGRPVQRIAPEGGLPLPIVDLSAVPDREAEARALAALEASRPFDLSRGPLNRTLLVRLTPTDHIFLLVQHHIISDGWSVDLLLSELKTIYSALFQDERLSLPGLALQPADLAVWQRETLQGAKLEKLLGWWKERLGGSRPLLELPADRPRPAVRSVRGAVVAFPLGRGLISARDRFAQATPFMICFAAFKALLFRLTGQPDLLVGFPSAGRGARESEGLIGFFVNTLVLRTGVADDPPFADLVKRVRNGVLDASEHQEMPFELLVDELHPERGLSHLPLIQVMFTYRQMPETQVRLPGLLLVGETAATGISKFDLTLGIGEEPGGFTGRLEYSSDLFDATTVQRLGRAYQLLLDGALNRPQDRLSELPLLDDAERQQLVAEWNDTRRQDPGELIHNLFAEQALHRPDAPALVSGDVTVTYGELAARAARLADELRSRGVGADVRVGVLLERSPEMIVAFLGVLMAGGAYVPIDAAMPLERRNALLQDSGVEVMIKSDGIGRIVDGAAAESEPEPENLAYVMFTSGSTGKPKGVAVTHRAVVRLVRDTEYAAFGPDQVFLQLSAPSFDASTFEIWGCLLHGGKLMIAPPGPPSLAEIAATVRDQGVTTLWLTAGLFHAMVEDERFESLSGLSQLLAGGDALSPPHVRRALTALPHVRMINGYGPTECTTFACCHTVTPWEPLGGSIPIGRPIGNTRAFVVDPWMQPAPIGVPGDLLLGGDGLARGYLSEPVLTAERFIPDPHSGVAGARLYRTGDRARVLPDGRLEFLGRIDHQLKIRGFRIEPAEIEAALADHFGVAETAVVAEGREAHSRRLVAFVTPRPGVGVEPRELREWLKQRLPLYMIPAALAIVDELPLTSNGKVDRRALEERSPGVVGAERESEPPRTDLERGLANVWAELLRVGSVGRDDNFFDLGGDSLTAIQMVARAGRAGIDLSLRQLFRHQTVAELAADIETRAGRGIQGEQGWVTGPVPMTPGQVWFFDRIAEHLKSPHQFSNARLLELREPVPSSRLVAAAAWMLFQHDALRLRVVCRDGVWEQHNAGPEALDDAINEVDLSALSDRDRDAAIQEVARQLFGRRELEGPLTRFVILRPDRLLVMLHHLVSDAASLSLLREDLETALSQLARGLSGDQSVRLPAKTTSFRSWALRQSEMARSDDLRRQVDYWLELARRGSRPLPADFPGGEAGTGDVDNLRSDLDEDGTRRLLQTRRFTDLLLTAVTRAFHRWTGSGTVLLRQSLHGRDPVFDDVDLSRTLGWISTTAPVLLELAGTETPSEALAAIAAQIERVPLRGLGYGVLRYMTGDPEIEASMATVVKAPAATFNFIGRFEGEATPSPFRELPLDRAPGKLAPRRDPQLRIEALVAPGPRLVLTWQYGRDFYRRETIERLAAVCLEELTALTG